MAVKKGLLWWLNRRNLLELSFLIMLLIWLPQRKNGSFMLTATQTAVIHIKQDGDCFFVKWRF